MNADEPAPSIEKGTARTRAAPPPGRSTTTSRCVSSRARRSAAVSVALTLALPVAASGAGTEADVAPGTMRRRRSVVEYTRSESTRRKPSATMVTLPAARSIFLKCTSHSSTLFLGTSWPRYFHLDTPTSCSKLGLAMPLARPWLTLKSSITWCIDSTPSEPGMTESHQK